MDTKWQLSFSKEGKKASRKHKMYDQDPKEEQKHKRNPKRTQWFFLDPRFYEDLSPDNKNKTWIDAETKDGIKFKVSLCTESPPCFSRLFFKTDDAAGYSPTSTLSFDEEEDPKRISIGAVACGYNATLIHTYVVGTFPHSYHDYFLLKNYPTYPVISRIPDIPDGHANGFGLLYQDGHYTVGVLKKHLPVTTETGTSMLAGYKRTEVAEGPFICTFSTFTHNWSTRFLSSPVDLTNWKWHSHTVLAYGNRLWWVDLCTGILSCEVHQEQPALDFTPLPRGCINKSQLVENDITALVPNRSVNISNGVLRCVQIFRKQNVFFNYGVKSVPCEDYVRMWTRRDGEWIETCTLTFAGLWKDRSYSSRGLPKFVPAYPTVDPSDPQLINFFLSNGKGGDGFIIGVNVYHKKVQYCSEACWNLLHMRGLEMFEFSVA